MLASSAPSTGRYRISTGYVRPDTSMTGAGVGSPPGSAGAAAKCRAKLSGSMVAEVTMTLRSGRFGRMRRR